MSSASWWDKATIEYKKRAVRVLNGEAFSLGEVRLPGLRRYKQFRKGLLTGEESHTFVRLMRKTWKLEQDTRDQLAAIVRWRNGADLPPDIRRCRYRRCSRFLLVRSSRVDRCYCSPKCGRNYRASKSMNAKIQKVRERKLKRVRLALGAFQGRPDWKEQAARQARVSPNFISYAIRRGELPSDPGD
jgi:hypothetical protein